MSLGAPQRRVVRCGINRPSWLKIDDMRAVVTKSCGIDKCGTERMALFEHDRLPPDVRIDDIVVEAVGLGVVRVVIEVCPE